jgi:hypothetical protein
MIDHGATSDEATTNTNKKPPAKTTETTNINKKTEHEQQDTNNETTTTNITNKNKTDHEPQANDMKETNRTTTNTNTDHDHETTTTEDPPPDYSPDNELDPSLLALFALCLYEEDPPDNDDTKEASETEDTTLSSYFAWTEGSSHNYYNIVDDDIYDNPRRYEDSYDNNPGSSWPQNFFDLYLSDPFKELSTDTTTTSTTTSTLPAKPSSDDGLQFLRDQFGLLVGDPTPTTTSTTPPAAATNNRWDRVPDRFNRIP